MNDPVESFLSINQLFNELQNLGVTQKAEKKGRSCTCLFDELITEPLLRKKTEKLYKDGHHAQAVEAAYKLLDNVVKKKAGLTGAITGSSLMQTAFSAKEPILQLNECSSASEKDEQLGYMGILSGCMNGIRNPRSHDSDWEDTEQRALQLIVFANHLLDRVNMATKQEKPTI
jgi:uncharacterized protein (TIGR02391 family)